jgi:ATP/maltotriose-dependent transcriptional regulator MalT
VMPLLQRRAAQWHERNGQPAEALGYWMRAGEADSAGRLVGSLAFPAYQQGRVATAEQWFGWLEDHGAPANQPAVAVLAAMVAALTGKPGEAERWAEAAERGAAVASLPDGSLSIEPWLALLRALLCRDGAEQMRADAELAAKTMAAGSFWRTAGPPWSALRTAYLAAGRRRPPGPGHRRPVRLPPGGRGIPGRGRDGGAARHPGMGHRCGFPRGPPGTPPRRRR